MKVIHGHVGRWHQDVLLRKCETPFLSCVLNYLYDWYPRMTNKLVLLRKLGKEHVGC